MKSTPRRSSRIYSENKKKTPLILNKQRRSSTGRLINCSTQAAKDFRSPINSSVDSALSTRRKSDLSTRTLQLSILSSDVMLNDINGVPDPPFGHFDFCGLPDDVIKKYCELRKISDLYDWQKDCLSRQKLLNGSNYIISLPTGAGKTLIAEILMLREAIVKKRSSILVLPYVAIVQEKINSLAFFEDHFDIRVEEYASSKGRIPPIKRRKGYSIYVATIEKANMLINSLIETEKISSIGLLVIDELHMIGEGSRGAILEQQLTKFQFAGVGQIIGISATLSNMNDLERFLRAYVYSTNFRPVELAEFVKIENSIWKVHEGKLIWNADLPPNPLEKPDPDGIIQLIRGVIPEKSVIIFCPTKKNCVNVALLIAKMMPKNIKDSRKVMKEKIIASIKEDGDGNIDSELATCLISGVAYHHSGLTHDERKHIETAYTEGILSVICATSTLAAGVNLPARRVIIKAPLVGITPLTKAQYLQMVGRAGRAGFNEKGDSITIVRKGLEERQFREMLNSPMLSCYSSMNEPENLMALILDIVKLKLAKNVDDIMEALQLSLVFVQKRTTLFEIVSKCIDHLIELHLLCRNEEGNLLSTELGNSTYDANIHPNEAPELELNLKKSLDQGIVFSSHFHLLFTIVPLDVGCEINWDKFHEEYRKLPKGEKTLLETIGVPEKCMIQALVSRKRLKPGDPEMRLYIAMMLQKVWDHDAHGSIAQSFGVDKGWLQSVLQGAISRASSIAKFSEKQTNLWPFRLLLPELVQRLSECVRTELIPLMAIEGVKRGRAHQLFSAGYKTITSVAKADFKELIRSIEHLRKFQAIKIINSAKSLLRDQIDEKMEDIEAMGVDLKDIVQS